MINNGKLNKKVLILTSTFPRWKGDATPSFVLDFCKNILPFTEGINVLAPHFNGAKNQEDIEGVRVRRYRYWWPASGQNIAYEGGAVSKAKKSLLYALKLKFLLLSLFFNTLYQALRYKPVINAHWLIPQGFIAIVVKILTRRKVVITVHGSDVFALNHKLLLKVKRFVLKRADEVVVNSSATKEACQAIYTDRDYHVIPMGVDIENMFVKKEKDDALKSQLGIEGFTVLFVGRLSEEKGEIYLCEAMKRLAAEDSNTKLLIVGDGPEKHNLKKYIRDNNLTKNIVIIGWVAQSELVNYYTLADVFAGPSIESEQGLREAFGLVFVEALATGTPVIATNTGGIPDIVQDGHNGFLVKQQDSDAIADKLLLLKNDDSLRVKLSENSQDYVLKKFSWNTVSQKYKKILFKD